VRFTDEELKHQELFRRVDRMIAADMPAGYRFTAEPNAVAAAVLRASTWAVLGLTCDIEIFTQVHYRASIQPREHDISEVFKDVFLHHWQEESQHAILDELEWKRENAPRARRARQGGRRPDRPGRRRRRHPAGAGERRRRLLRRRGRPGLHRRGNRGGARRVPQGLSLAVHRVRRDRAALPADPVRHDRRRAEDAHHGGARAAALRDAAPTRAAKRVPPRPRSDAFIGARVAG
jgi:hypothetical protein